jgi:hypothetical protein
MKALSSLAILSLSFSLHAKTTLEFAAKASFGATDISITKLNKKLAAKGLEGLPEKIVVSKTDVPYMKLIEKRVDAVNEAFKDTYLYFNGTNSYMHDMEDMCYRGKPSEVKAIITALRGTLFQEDQGLYAVRYLDKKSIFAGMSKIFFENNAEMRQGYEENGNTAITEWDNFDTSSDTVAVISDLGPEGDGTELYLTEIKRCK